jgi:predicted RNA binding protein YcfA (HicA-like mRNA interferase family)
MVTLPVLSGKEVVKRFENLGWRVARQSSSHIIMTKEGEIATLPFPIIGKSRKER